MSSDSEGWVYDGEGRPLMTRMQGTTPGTEAASELQRELNAVLRDAVDERVEQQIVDARERIEDYSGDALTEGFREAAECIGTARDVTSEAHVEDDLRELRGVLVDLAGGGA